LEIGRGLHPGTILDDSPSHIVGCFIRDNMASSSKAAMAEERALARSSSRQPRQRAEDLRARRARGGAEAVRSSGSGTTRGEPADHAIGTSGAVRTLDMEAGRTVASAAHPCRRRTSGAIALLLLRAA
jgi:hypothetical protein